MKRTVLFALTLLLYATVCRAQTTTFVPNCGGDDDTARFVTIIGKIGSNTGTIRLPYKADIRCAVGNLTIPDNITLDNSDGTGISVKTGATLLVLGPVVNPVGRPIFYGTGAVSFVGNSHIGASGQALLSAGDGTTTWGNVSGGGPGGPTTGTGATVLQTNPTLINPVLGDATATTINKVTITPPATSATLTIADGKTLTVSNSLTLSATDGVQLALGQPLTIGGTGAVTINGGGILTLGSFSVTAPTSGTFALGAGSLSVSSINNGTLGNHTHAIATSANPGPTASILASNSNGYLQLERLGLGTAPTQPLEVAGNALISGATANLFLKDTSTGWQSSTSTVINPQINNSVCSQNYTSGLLGWCIHATGNAEFNNVDVRGAIRTSVFLYNEVQSTAGTLGVFKSAGKLKSDITIPGSPIYGTSTVNIDIVDADGVTHAASQLFAVNDILRLKDGLIGDTWLRVAAASDQTTFWRYNATIMAGSNNVTYRNGLGVPDYGPAGQGFIIQTADQANAPYLQMATHQATFTALNAGGTLIFTPQLRLGNLNGSYAYASDTYGFAAGSRAPGQSWITVDPTNGVRIGNNTSVLPHVDPGGIAASNGSTTASSGTIASWVINPTTLTSGSVTIAASSDQPLSGDAAWFGKRATDNRRGVWLRDSSGRIVNMMAGYAGNYPYMSANDGTHTRVVIGGLNFAFESDGATNSMGMKVWSSTGSKLVEFSDVQNMIAGLSITATRASVGSGATTAGLDSTVTGGDDVRIFAGSATPSSAPFRVTEAGALTATNATITGAR